MGRSTSSEAAKNTVLMDGKTASGRPENKVKSIGEFGVGVGGNTLQFPIDLLYNITNGFHNAPAHLLGDRTIRMRNDITGVKSGLKAGVEEVCFGFYDAVTGIVTQPVHGFEQDGTVGLVKGVGRGVGGLVCKSVAGTLGFPSYSLKGLAKSVRRGWRESDAAPDEEAIAFLKRLEHRGSVGGQGVVPGQMESVALTYVGKATGKGVMRMVMRRRTWQNHTELLQLRQDSESAVILEYDVLTKWKSLNVSIK